MELKSDTVLVELSGHSCQCSLLLKLVCSTMLTLALCELRCVYERRKCVYVCGSVKVPI